MTLIERMASRRPTGLPAGFLAAWAKYTAARDALSVAGAVPPEGYRPDLPERRRLRRWTALDHPEIDRPLCDLLRIVAGLARR